MLELEASKGKTAAIKADVSREDQALAMFDELRENFGTVDILVCNACLQGDSPFVDMTLQSG